MQPHSSSPAAVSASGESPLAEARQHFETRSAGVLPLEPPPQAKAKPGSDMVEWLEAEVFRQADVIQESPALGPASQCGLLPVGIVIPTLNVRPSLPGFLDGLRPLLPLVQEVVLVDSFSEDGTLDWLKAHLRHPRVRYLSHPRGLYQSWNYGIQHIHSEFTYIATVGDYVTAAGLRHLHAIAERSQCDVVVSQPKFYDGAGGRIPSPRWPIHKFLDRCAVAKPLRLEPWRVLLLSLLDLPDALVGSSASDLYRTETLKSRPFPTDCGHIGDTGWCIRNSLHISLAVTPLVFSRFVLHHDVSSMPQAQFLAVLDRLNALAAEAGREALASSRVPSFVKPLIEPLCGLRDEQARLCQLQDRYNRARHEFWPWFANPFAWQARSRRNRQRARVFRLREQAYQCAAVARRLAGSECPERELPSHLLLAYACERILD